MKRLQLIGLILLIFGCDSDTSEEAICSQHRVADDYSISLAKNNMQPDTLEDALIIMEDALTEDQKLSLKCQVVSQENVFAPGMSGAIRYHFELWNYSKLYQDMEKRGFIHPDDMSASLIFSLARKLRREDIQLEQQIAHYRDYWTANNESQ